MYFFIYSALVLILIIVYFSFSLCCFLDPNFHFLFLSVLAYFYIVVTTQQYRLAPPRGMAHIQAVQGEAHSWATSTKENEWTTVTSQCHAFSMASAVNLFLKQQLLLATI